MMNLKRYSWDFHRYVDEWGSPWWLELTVTERFSYDLNRFLSTEHQGVQGTVYVLKAGDFYKIGRSTTPLTRIPALKIQLPFPVEIFTQFEISCCVAAERFLHLTLGQYRKNGEWFELSADLASLLKASCEGWSE